MTEITAIIADDEKPLRTYLRRRLTEIWPELAICGEAGSGDEALNLVHRHHPDIAFLDIRMPGSGGLDVAAQVSRHSHVVLVTAYDSYAVEAFEQNAVDYLLKPVSNERLEETVRRLRNRIQKAEPQNHAFNRILSRLKQLETGKRKGLRWIRAQHRDTIRLIPVDDVICFKAEAKYTTVRTETGDAIIRKSLKDLENELDPIDFWRIHRKAIINVNWVDRVSTAVAGRYMVKMQRIDEILSVSRSHAHKFRQM